MTEEKKGLFGTEPFRSELIKGISKEMTLKARTSMLILGVLGAFFPGTVITSIADTLEKRFISLPLEAKLQIIALLTKISKSS